MGHAAGLVSLLTLSTFPANAVATAGSPPSAAKRFSSRAMTVSTTCIYASCFSRGDGGRRWQAFEVLQGRCGRLAGGWTPN